MITSRATLAGDPDDDARLVRFATRVAAAGVDALQVRERDWPDGRLFAVTAEIVCALHGSGCRVLVNERAHVAWAAGADGVHLRADGMAASRWRAVAPSGFLIGRSLHMGAVPSDTADVDLVVFGSVYRSASKRSGSPVAGPAALARLARQPGMPPVLAVGGLTPARCVEVRRAGARGMAAIGVFAAADAAGADALAQTVRDIHAVFGDLERSQ